MRFEPSVPLRRAFSPVAESVPAFERPWGAKLDLRTRSRRGRRLVPFVRRSGRRAGLDPQRRSGSGTDPPVFYGGKPGKSLTAIPIMASFARIWELSVEFARGHSAVASRMYDQRVPIGSRVRCCPPCPTACAADPITRTCDRVLRNAGVPLRCRIRSARFGAATTQRRQTPSVQTRRIRLRISARRIF